MFSKRWRHRQPLQAVHDRDLEELLSSLGILDSVRGESVFCEFCGEALTIESLGGLFPREGEIGVWCDKSECMQALLLIEAGAGDE